MKLMTAREIQSQLDYLKYSRDDVHGYSKAIGRLFDLTASYVYDAEKAYKKGKNAVWAMGSWEVPLIYACDTIPVSYGEMGRLAGLDAITVAEDYYQLPQESCSMVKSVIGEWHRRKAYGIKRILGTGAMCEPFNLAWEVMKKEGYDVHNIDVVYRGPGVKGERYEQLVEFFVEEIYRVADWLTDGKGLNKDLLRYEIQRRNRLLAKMRRIMELRLKHPLYIRSLAVMYLLGGLTTYFGKPEEFTELLDQLIEEMENAPLLEGEDKIIPLVWAGGRGQEFGLYHAVDEAGGALLGFVSTPYSRNYREDVPPVESLARFVLEGEWAGASVYSRQVIEDQIEKVNAQGLILYGYLGCSFGSVAREMWRDYFHKKGVPCISLEGTFQIGMPSGQILTRVKAFVEMLS